MKLIREISEAVEYDITEATDGGKKSYYIEGVYMQAELKNKNGRMYPMSVMEAAVDKYVETYVKDDRAYGELNHPSGPTVNLQEASHRILSLEKDGTDYIGRSRILDTPNGRIVKAIIEDGGKIGVSSRGLGNLRESRGMMEVQPGFMIATAADIVADPSAPNAFMTAVMEGADWVLDEASGNYVVANTLDRIIEDSKTMTMEELEENAIAMFSSFMASMSK